MKHNAETIVDESGIEVLVGYDYNKQDNAHPETAVFDTELTSVEVVIGGRGIDILKQLTEPEKDFIVSKLNYE